MLILESSLNSSLKFNGSVFEKSNSVFEKSDGSTFQEKSKSIMIIVSNVLYISFFENISINIGRTDSPVPYAE